MLCNPNPKLFFAAMLGQVLGCWDGQCLAGFHAQTTWNSCNVATFSC